MPTLKYKRVLLKISGEALGGASGFGLDPKMFRYVAQEIKKVHQSGVQLVIVVGGGNMVRGVDKSTSFGIPRVPADHIGMESTVINAILLEEVLRSMNVPAVALSALGKTKAIKNYSVQEATLRLKQNQVVICAGGTGEPFFSTDTASLLRAVQTGCDIVLKATKVDGVYTDDPMKNKKAKKYDTLSYTTALENNLHVMDQTAFALARENKMPILVFNLFTKDSILKAAKGEHVGTLVQ